MTTALHKHLVADLAADGWQATGWRRGVMEAVRGFLRQHEPDPKERAVDLWELGQAIGGAGAVRPDAWRVRVEGPDNDPDGFGWFHPVLVIEVAEAVVTHPVQGAREWQYVGLCYQCEASPWLDFRQYEVRPGTPLRCHVSVRGAT